MTHDAPDEPRYTPEETAALVDALNLHPHDFSDVLALLEEDPGALRALMAESGGAP